jgi:hypothetical protein
MMPRNKLRWVALAVPLAAACRYPESRWPTSLPTAPSSDVSSNSTPPLDPGVRLEVVALRAYERLLDPNGWNVVRALDIVQRYPDTYAASMLRGRLGKTAEDAARRNLTLEELAEFLDGEPIPLGPELASIGVDDSSFRIRYEEELRDELGERLLEDGCETLMAYCTWWVDRYPEDPRSAEFEQRMGEVWARRIRPGWKGRRHHRCAWRCGTTCRAQAEPLDDSCYAPCYETCL